MGGTKEASGLTRSKNKRYERTSLEVDERVRKLRNEEPEVRRRTSKIGAVDWNPTKVCGNFVGVVAIRPPGPSNFAYGGVCACILHLLGLGGAGGRGGTRTRSFSTSGPAEGEGAVPGNREFGVTTGSGQVVHNVLLPASELEGGKSSVVSQNRGTDPWRGQVPISVVAWRRSLPRCPQCCREGHRVFFSL